MLKFTARYEQFIFAGMLQLAVCGHSIATISLCSLEILFQLQLLHCGGGLWAQMRD